MLSELSAAGADREALHLIDAVLRALATDAVPHGRWSLRHHLRGTAAILAAWRQPSALRAAGMLHSIYSTEAFERRTVALTERARVCALAGAEAEWLAYLFCALRRDDVFTAAAAKEGRTFRSRFDAELLNASAADVGHLVILHMANAADQDGHRGGTATGSLARLSRLGRLVHDFGPGTPPVFDACTVELTAEDDHDLVDTYEAALRAPRSPDAMRTLTQLASGHGRFVAEPSIVASLLHLAHGEAVVAGNLARSALRIAATWNTSWDKRLSCEQWRTIATFVAASASDADTSTFVGACALRAIDGSGGSPSALYVLLDEVGAFAAADRAAGNDDASTRSQPERTAHRERHDGDALPRRFTSYLRSFANAAAPNAMLWYPDLPRQPWHDPRATALGRELERRAPEIIAELLALDKDAFHAESERIRRSGRWDVLMLLERGVRNDAVAQRCPITMAVLDACGAIAGPAGLAYVSRLKPGSRVAPHCGPTNLRLRCHLGIDVPDDCGLRVGAATRTWRQGRCLLFDDSFDHEAWNLGSRDRLVLVVDVWHPDLSEEEVGLIASLQGQIERQARTLSDYWRNNDRSREQQTAAR